MSARVVTSRYFIKFLNNAVQITLLHTPPPLPWGFGGQVENVSSVSPACRKRRLIGAMCRDHRVKRVVPCWCLDRTGTLKDPTKCLWRWEPNFFFSPPVHLCAVTYDWNIVDWDVKQPIQLNSATYPVLLSRAFAKAWGHFKNYIRPSVCPSVCLS